MIINLDQDFSPLGIGISPKDWKYPDGTIGIRFENSDKWILGDSVQIAARLNSHDKLIKLLLVTDALRRIGVIDIDLFISYLLYARDDRQMTAGSSFSLSVISKLLGSQNYRHIGIYDVHSNIATALINNSVSIPNFAFVKKALGDRKDYLLVAPDFGSQKKIYELAKFLNYDREIVLCNKVRDLASGKIVDLEVYAKTDLKGRELIIVDDICSKGGTFIQCAKKLKDKGASEVGLIVTHYEGTANPLDLKIWLDFLYCTNSFCDGINALNFVQQIPLSLDIIYG